MANEQNNRERIIDQIERGLLTTAQGNVQMVRNERVRVVTKLSKDVRKVLNQAVKDGELGHMKKEGRKPEVYFHPTFKYLANEKRGQAENKTIRVVNSVCI